MAPNDIDERILRQALVERGLVAREPLERLIQEQTDSFQAIQKTLPGFAFLVHLDRHTLEMRDMVSGQTRKNLLLNPQGHAFRLDDWEPWGASPLLVQSVDGTQVGRMERSRNPVYGLVTLPSGSYFYNNGRLDTEFLGMSDTALFSGIYKGKPLFSPYDLFLARDRSMLCVADRGAGTLRVISTTDFSERGLVSIREAGSNLSLNVLPVPDRDAVFITDNQTSNLYVLDLKTLKLERQRLGLGVLGNLQLAPDGEHLFVLTLKPNQNLVFINLNSFEVKKTIKLKGDLFKVNSSDPADLLTLSPDQKHLLVMTYLNEPVPFTPVVTVLEAESAKTLRRYSVKEEGKPSQFVFAEVNPFMEHVRRLEDMLLDARLIDPRVLWDLKRELRELQELETPGAPPASAPTTQEPESEPEVAISEAAEAAVAITPEETPQFLDIEQHVIAVSVLRKDQQPKDQLTITPGKAPHIDLPFEAIDEIMDILVQTFQKQVNEEITEYPDVMQRLRDESERVRQELESYDAALVQVADLFEGQGLRTVILREAIVMMLDLKASLKAAGTRTVPTHCPNCRQPLLGSWDCEACGFEIDNAERAFKRRTASAEPTANLARGQVLIPDPLGLRVLQLNPFKFVTWNLDPDQLSCDYPVDCLMLPNHNLLLLDKDGHKLMEIGPRGKIFWSFDTHLSARHRLREPVRVTYRYEDDDNSLRYLIVDQGQHRVLEIDKEHQIHWEFGIQGNAGGGDKQLNAPGDAQYTHDHTYLIADTGNDRVIEIKRGGIERSWGPELGLRSPTCAQRLLNDHTLILDAGNYRLLELDASGQVIKESRYYTREIDEEFRVVHPIKMIRLINKDLLIMDEDKLIQVMLSQNRLVWYSRLDDLAFQPQVQAGELITDEYGNERRIYKLLDHGEIKPVRLSQKINFKRMQKLIAARLSHEGLSDEDDPDRLSSVAADRLRSLLANRKAEQARAMQELNLETFQPSAIFQKPDLEMPNIRRYCIDKHHNALIRINRKGEVKWHYGFEVGQTLSRPYYIAETKRTLLISDTGHNRVLELSKADKEVIAEFRGPSDSPLSGPRSAVRTLQGRTLIADQRSKRLVELDGRDRVVWEFNKAGQIASPQYAEELENGDVLFADAILNSIRQIDRNGNLRWSYGSRMKGSGPGQLFAPEYATRLPNGNTLIADTRNNRVVEVEMNGIQVWSYQGQLRQKIMNPTRCERTEEGNTIIIYNNHREVIEVSPAGETLWYFRMGNDVFLPPVQGIGGKQLVEKLQPYYNPIEKRLVRMAEKDGMKGFEIHVTMFENVQMKSVRASLVLMALEQHGTVIKTFPTPEEILADKFGRYMIVAFIGRPDVRLPELEEDVVRLSEVEKAVIQPISFEESVSVGG